MAAPVVRRVDGYFCVTQPDEQLATTYDYGGPPRYRVFDRSRVLDVPMALVAGQVVLSASIPFETETRIPHVKTERSRGALTQGGRVVFIRPTGPAESRDMYARTATAAMVVAIFFAATVKSQSCFLHKGGPRCMSADHVQQIRRWYADLEELCRVVKCKLRVALPLVEMPESFQGLDSALGFVDLVVGSLGDSLGMRTPCYARYAVPGKVKKYRRTAVSINED